MLAQFSETFKSCFWVSIPHPFCVLGLDDLVFVCTLFLLIASHIFPGSTQVISVWTSSVPHGASKLQIRALACPSPCFPD